MSQELSFWLKLGVGASAFVALAVAARRLLPTSLIKPDPNSPLGIQARWAEVFELLQKNEVGSRPLPPNSIVSSYLYNTFAEYAVLYKLMHRTGNTDQLEGHISDDTIGSLFPAANSPNEDAWSASVYAGLDGGLRNLFGIFDGHSTRAASAFCQAELFGFIERRLHILDRAKQRQAAAIKDKTQRESFERLFAEKREILIEHAIEMAFRDADQHFLTESIITHLLQGDSLDKCISGTCVITAFVENGILFVANVGDCRGVLATRSDADGSLITVEMSTDQNTDNPNEVRRIQRLHPSDPRVVNNGRVKGILRPTRNIGGALLKEMVTKEFVAPNCLAEPWEPPYTTCKPEIAKRKLTANDKFLVLASDGLWDLMSSQEAVQIVADFDERSRTGSLPPDFTGSAASYLLMKALERVPVVLNERARKPGGAAEAGDSNLDKLNYIFALAPPARRSVYDDISIIIVYFDTNRASTPAASPTTGELSRPVYPGSIERVEKFKAMFAGHSRAEAPAKSPSAALINKYLKNCWPTNSGLWTKKNRSTTELFLKLGLLAPVPATQLQNLSANTSPSSTPAPQLDASASAAAGNGDETLTT